MNQCWDTCTPDTACSLVQANPPEAGLVAHRRTIQVSQREATELEVPR